MSILQNFRGAARMTLFAGAVLAAALGMACSGESGGDTAGGKIRLQGGGATFPASLYQKWVSEYGKSNPDVQIDYQSIGSGGGVKGIQDQTFDFGASDAPMKDDEIAKNKAEILHVPTVLGAVVVTYNLPDVKEALNLSPEVIADIFLGKITKWDDARIKADNPNAKLPSADIGVVHRTDGSGTTAVFTDYLAKVSPEWKDKVGADKVVNWPVGQGGKGNEGVMGAVKNQPNTFGYVELLYALEQKLPVANVKNKAGKFVTPTVDSVTAAAAGNVATMPDDLRTSITNADGADAYPISSYTYLLVYKDQKDATKGKALVDFMWWALHDGQGFAKEKNFSPLPGEVLKKAEAKINSITSGGQPLRK